MWQTVRKKGEHTATPASPTETSNGNSGGLEMGEAFRFKTRVFCSLDPLPAERLVLPSLHFCFTQISCLVHPLRPFIIVTGSGKMDSETCKRLGYNFTKGFLQPPI